MCVLNFFSRVSMISAGSRANFPSSSMGGRSLILWRVVPRPSSGKTHGTRCGFGSLQATPIHRQLCLPSEPHNTARKNATSTSLCHTPSKKIVCRAKAGGIPSHQNQNFSRFGACQHTSFAGSGPFEDFLWEISEYPNPLVANLWPLAHDCCPTPYPWLMGTHNRIMLWMAPSQLTCGTWYCNSAHPNATT